MKLEMPRGAWGGDKWVSYYYTLDTSNWPSIDCPDGFGANCNGGNVHRVDQLPPHLERTGQPDRPGRSGPQADAEARVHPRSRSRAARAHVARRPLRPQGLGRDDRRHRRLRDRQPGLRRGLQHRQPRQGHRQDPDRAADRPDRAGSGQRLRRPRIRRPQALLATTGRRRRASCSAVCTATTAGSRARTRTAASRRTSAATTTRCSSRSTEKGNEAIGRLNTDRPVQFKLQGSYTMPWGTNIGANFYAFSGLLQSSTVTYQGVPVYFKGRGDLGRTPMLNQTDLLVSHDLQDLRQHQARPPGEHHQPVRPGHGHRLATAAYRDAMVIPGFGEPRRRGVLPARRHRRGRHPGGAAPGFGAAVADLQAGERVPGRALDSRHGARSLF